MESRTKDYGAIGWAMNAIRNNHSVRRASWPAGQRLVYVPAEVSNLPHKMGDGGAMQAYVALVLPDSSTVPWSCTNADLMADDWAYANPVQPGETHLEEPPEVPVA